MGVEQENDFFLLDFYTTYEKALDIVLGYLDLIYHHTVQIDPNNV